MNLMGKHTPLEPTVGRHTLPLPKIEPPAPKRPRVRNDRWLTAVQTLNVLLAGNGILALFFLTMCIVVLLSMGPEDLPGFILCMFGLWCWSRRPRRDRPQK